jgi:ABC-type uncharacterized transport system involved in gliding motility auxiliary subunit
MNNELRRYAPIGLIVSGLAVLAAGLLFIVKMLASANIFTLPDSALLDRALWVTPAIAILGLALSAFLDPEGARRFLTGRQAKYGSNSLIMLVAFAGILFFVNLIVYENPKTWDLTEDKQNTLAPETIDTLAALPEPVHARAYYTVNFNSEEDQRLLDNFKQNSNGKFTYEFINPELNPVAAERDQVTRDGTIVLLMGEQRETVGFASEKEMVFAMIRLMNPQDRVIYFLTGHGERDVEQPGETSYTALGQTLQSKNYTVKTLSLLTEGSVPADAQVVVVAGPNQPLAQSEVAALEAYLTAGGSLVVMSEPTSLTKFGDSPDLLAGLTAKWGVAFNNDFIVDPNAQPAIFAVADPLKYAQHPITEKLRGVYSVFPTSRSLKLTDAPANLVVTTLAASSPNAWGETDTASLDNNSVNFDPATDTAGPLTLAVAVEDPQVTARLVVFGDSEFSSDALFQQGYGDILINAIDWAAEQDNIINLTAKEPTLRTYTPPTTLGLVGIILASLCLIPLLVIGAGVGAWLSRRRQG